MMLYRNAHKWNMPCCVLIHLENGALHHAFGCTTTYLVHSTN